MKTAVLGRYAHLIDMPEYETFSIPPGGFFFGGGEKI